MSNVASPAPRGGPRRFERASILAPAALGAVLIGYQLSRPNALKGVTGLDEGVYFGAALRLSHGLLPYTDFRFVQPPGIAILMLPVALLGRIIGEGNAFAVARVVTGLVAVVNVGLIAAIVRRHGAAASISAGLLAACFPLAVSATHTVVLEPYLLLFTLLAVHRLFDETGAVADDRRVWIAGLLFGVAGLVKTWALLPMLAATVVVIAATRSRRRAGALIGGAAVGFGAPAFVFVLLAPIGFVEQVVGAQIGRTGSGTWALSISERLSLLTGLEDFPTAAGASTAGWITMLVVSLIALVFALCHQRLRPADWFTVCAAGVAVGGVLASATFYRYYAYFPIAMVALVVGTCVGLVRSTAIDFIASTGRSRSRAVTASTAGLSIVAGVLALAVVPHDFDYIRVYLSPARDSSELLRRNIPAGSCVVFDEPGPLIAADRFSTGDRSCPREIDPYGLFLTENDGRETSAEVPFDPSFVALWQQSLERADFVVLAVPGSSFVPWTPALEEQFARQFELIANGRRTFIYRRRA